MIPPAVMTRTKPLRACGSNKASTKTVSRETLCLANDSAQSSLFVCELSDKRVENQNVIVKSCLHYDGVGNICLDMRGGSVRDPDARHFRL